MLVGVGGSILMAVVVRWMSVVDLFQRSLRATLAEADDLLRLAAAVSLVAVALTVPSLVGEGAGGGTSTGGR